MPPVSLTSWAEAAALLRPLRNLVFVEEQGVPASLEMDDRDVVCVHAIALHEGRAVATGRLLPAENGVSRIGRMAVLREWRGMGLGARVLAALMQAARARGDREIELHAQLHAAPFYDKLGYARVGDVYEEAGIPHVNMRCPL
jgi:predicted GNAT family N-acyltransferase